MPSWARWEQAFLSQKPHGHAATPVLDHDDALEIGLVVLGKLGAGPESLIAVSVPTTRLSLGDIVIRPPRLRLVPDVTMDEGLRTVRTGGMLLPGRIAGTQRGAGT